MKILLVSARRSAYTGESISAPHQGILSLAAALRQGTFYDTKGVNIEVVDDQLIVIDRPWAPPSACLQGRNPDVVGVQVTTSSLKNGVKLLSEVRALFPNALRVMGGVGAGPSAHELIESGIVEVVVRGEADQTFSHLIYVLGTVGRKGFLNVNGITFMDDNGKIVHNASPTPIANISILPLPARDLVDMQLYRKISRGRAGNLITSRGCSYACAYCYSRHHWGQGQRLHSIDRVMEEVNILVNEYGLDRIRIEDDDFLENKKWVFDLCDRLEREGFHHKVEWEAKARPDHLDEYTVRRLRQAGCFRLLVGIETLDPVLLKRMNRPLNLEVLEHTLAVLANGDIGVQATMILGIPGEKPEAMRHTIHWLEERIGKNRHDIVSPCFFVPFNIDVTKSMQRKNNFRIEVYDTDCYTGHIPVTSTDTCSLEELNRLYEEMAPDRRGKYKSIAHLATLDTVQNRVTAEISGAAYS